MRKHQPSLSYAAQGVVEFLGDFCECSLKCRWDWGVCRHFPAIPTVMWGAFLRNSITLFVWGTGLHLEIGHLRCRLGSMEEGAKIVSLGSEAG